MPQTLLPLITEGATPVNDCLSVLRESGRWTYFYGVQPVFAHPEHDRRSFRMFTAQWADRGVCRQMDIVRTFGVSKNSVKRSVKQYRDKGIEAFYRPRDGRGATVMKEEVVMRAQDLLNRGCSRKQVAEELGIKGDTLRKAVKQGRVQEPTQAERAKREGAAAGARGASDKSERRIAERRPGWERPARDRANGSWRLWVCCRARRHSLKRAAMSRLAAFSVRFPLWA